MTMRYLAIIISLLCWQITSACARESSKQLPSPRPAQQTSLAQLVNSDPEAKTLFGKLKEEADAALSSEPHPIAKIQVEGKLQTDPVRVQSQSSLEDMKKLLALGYVYTVTGNSAYSAKAKQFILSWAHTNQPTGDPIDETNLESLVTAYDLTRKNFSGDETAVVEAWLRRVAELEIKSRKEGTTTAINNWNSHRLKIVGMVAFILQDKNLIDYAVRGFKKQIEDNINADGSTFDFHHRDALHYHVYDLEPLLALAIAAKQNGVDLYGYRASTEASLDNAIRFLVPYCDGTKTHAEFVHSKVDFDRQRAAAGDEEYKAGSLFNPWKARRVFEYASAFDKNYLSMVYLIYRRDGHNAQRFPSWQIVLNAAQEPSLLEGSNKAPASDNSIPNVHASYTLTAIPNPVSSGAGFGTTEITWSTGDGSWGQVYVSVNGGPEKLFGQGREGAKDAPWIGAGAVYEFRLYEGSEHAKLRATVKVTKR